ncbi:MAG TPA: hypothetical protein VD794_10980, partial [Flavisolibacter sp.]|nr:hypothetical protein [Flavisolibacter sp.]
MQRSFYSNTIASFLTSSEEEILGVLAKNNDFALEQSQRGAWLQQIHILKKALAQHQGHVLFEYAIPRMGRRVDVVLIIQHVLFVLEFKVGETQYLGSAVDQVMDYCLDLKNFHETSHQLLIAPVLIATAADDTAFTVATTPHNDQLLFPIKTNASGLAEVLNNVLAFEEGESIVADVWTQGRYSPTPTIIEAAMALYNGHSVLEISRSDASAINLSQTSEALSA